MKIGQKIKLLLLTAITLSILGCWSKPFDIPVYIYTFHNKTADTLKLHFGTNAYDPDYTGIFTTEIPTNTLLRSVNNFELDEKENPVEELLTSSYKRFTQPVKVYRNDSLILTWEGPAYYGGSENHFYNINAWEIDDDYQSGINNGRVIFTIYPEDLNQSQSE